MSEHRTPRPAPPGRSQDAHRPDEALWAGDYRCTGRTAIEDRDGRLAACLISSARAQRRAHDVSRLTALVVVLSIGTWFAFFGHDYGPILATGAAVGAMILALGPVGASMEILFAGRGSCILFLAAIVVAVTGFLLEGNAAGDTGFWGLLSVVTFVFVITFGGGAALFLRWRDRPRLLALLRLAHGDLQRGEALAFERDVSEDDSEEDRARRLEVLPDSRIVYRIDGHTVFDLRQVALVGVGTPDAEAAAAPFAEGGRRMLSVSELEELSVALGGFGWSAIKRAAFASWATAFVLINVDKISQGTLDARPRPIVWAAALGVGLFVGVSRIRLQRRLSVDVRAGAVEQILEREGSGRRRLELLPQSRLHWRVDEVPAPWRRAEPDTRVRA